MVYVQPGNTRAQLGGQGQLLEVRACFSLSLKAVREGVTPRGQGVVRLEGRRTSQTYWLQQSESGGERGNGRGAEQGKTCSGKAALSLEEVRGLWNILVRAVDMTRVINRQF